MHKIAGKYMEAWNNAIREDERAVETLKGGTKRTVPLAEVDESELADVEGSWRNGTLDKVKFRLSRLFRLFFLFQIPNFRT